MEKLRLVSRYCKMNMEQDKLLKSKLQKNWKLGNNSTYDIAFNFHEKLDHQSRYHIEQNKNIIDGNLIGNTAINECQDRRHKRRRRDEVLVILKY